MAFPFAAVGLGLNALGAVGGILSGNSAVKRAREARERAYNEYMGTLDTKYRNAVTTDQRNLAGLKAKFGDLLLSGANTQAAMDASGLGGGLAKYGSTASVGDLLNRQSGYNEAMQGALTDTASREAQMLEDNRLKALQMRMGGYNEDLDRAYSERSGAAAGFSNLLSQVPSLFGPGRSPAITTGYEGDIPFNPDAQMPQVNPQMPVPSMPGGINMEPGVPLSRAALVNPIQKQIQTVTAGFSPAGNSYGPSMNGMFNGKLPKIGKSGAYVSPIKPLGQPAWG